MPPRACNVRTNAGPARAPRPPLTATTRRPRRTRSRTTYTTGRVRSPITFRMTTDRGCARSGRSRLADSYGGTIRVSETRLSFIPRIKKVKTQTSSTRRPSAWARATMRIARVPHDYRLSISNSFNTTTRQRSQLATGASRPRSRALAFPASRPTQPKTGGAAFATRTHAGHAEQNANMNALLLCLCGRSGLEVPACARRVRSGRVSDLAASPVWPRWPFRVDVSTCAVSFRPEPSALSLTIDVRAERM